MKPHQSSPSAADYFSRKEPPLQAISDSDLTTIFQQEICNPVPPSDSIVPSQTIISAEAMSEDLTLNPIKTESNHREPSPTIQPTSPRPDPAGLDEMKSLNLPLPLDQAPGTSQQCNGANGKVDATVAAQNMISAMTKGMKNQRLRRRSEQRDTAGVGGQHHAKGSDSNSHVLRRIFLAALTLLPESSERESVPAARTESNTKEGKEDLEKKDWLKCEYCGKQVRRQCDLKYELSLSSISTVLCEPFSNNKPSKHRKNHEKPYACTYPNCDKKFGKKIDWKCHETEDHFQCECWRCDLPVPASNRQCCRLFTRKNDYVNHLEVEHDIDQNNTRDFLLRNRIGRQGQSQYWCGFCRKIIPVQSTGKERQNERFDHIDFQHLKYAQRVDDWLPVSGHLTKRDQREEEERMEMERLENAKAANQSGVRESSDDQGTSRVASNNPRKRKGTAASSSSGQQQASSTGKRKRGRPPTRSKKASSHGTTQEQFLLDLSDISLLTKDDTPIQFQDFVYCVSSLPLIYYH